VYDADGTVTGEVRYFVGAHFLGDRHCSLCDITHGPLIQKAAWKKWKARIGIPVDALHRNKLPADVAAAANGVFPVVIAHRNDGTAAVLVGPEQLDTCGGQVAAFAAIVEPLIAESRMSET
jgi:hypothetical protein